MVSRPGVACTNS